TTYLTTCAFSSAASGTQNSVLLAPVHATGSCGATDSARPTSPGSGRSYLCRRRSALHSRYPPVLPLCFRNPNSRNAHRIEMRGEMRGEIGAERAGESGRSEDRKGRRKVGGKIGRT